MTLEDICEKIIDVEEGLMLGTISFSYDNLMASMKLGHPMEILDSILAQIYFDVINGRTPDLGKVQSVHKQLITFKTCFNVKQLEKPIKEMGNYIQEQEAGK